MSRITLESNSAQETERLGAALAAGLEPGDVVLVRGELGSGKTTLVRGACRALGVGDNVTSPTFVIGRLYRGRLPVAHIDLYRIEEPEAEDPGLLAEYLDPATVAFIEWPKGALSQHRVAAKLDLQHAGGDRRTIAIEGGRRALQGLKQRAAQ